MVKFHVLWHRCDIRSVDEAQTTQPRHPTVSEGLHPMHGETMPKMVCIQFDSNRGTKDRIFLSSYPTAIRTVRRTVCQLAFAHTSPVEMYLHLFLSVWNVVSFSVIPSAAHMIPEFGLRTSSFFLSRLYADVDVARGARRTAENAPIVAPRATQISQKPLFSVFPRTFTQNL